MSFWNQVKQQAGTLKAKTAEKTQECRLQNEINDIRVQIQKKQNSLGALVYQRHKEGREDYDALLPIFKEIEALEQEIVEIEQKLAELKIKPGTCPNCNYENIPDARFCASCGVPLREAADTLPDEPKEEPPAVVCPECQAEQPHGAKFCAQCGHTLE